ncbi:MAG: hypothetical protein K5663_11310 [Clostridiales bacterium]|nr:hypothetical protein [Clostridiales bacterium]
MADNGRWVTINGRRVFIGDGETPTEAIERSKQEASGSGARKVSAAEFIKTFHTAKATVPPEDAWRVDSTYTREDYEHKDCYVMGEGSTFAVTGEGDIVSVCKNQTDTVKGHELLREAVKNGGDRLDAFGKKLYNFYTRNGFEPVSWTEFDESIDLPGWVKGRDEPEPVIFYRYTGRQTAESYGNFLLRVKPSADYGAAQAIRDGLMEGDSK